MAEERQQGQYRPVDIEIGDRTYTLHMTWRAMRRIRDGTDGRVDFFEGGVGLGAAAGHDLPLIVWACIAHKQEGGDPDLTMEALEEQLDVGDLDRVAEAVFGMWGMDLGDLAAMAEEAEEATDADPLETRPEASATRSSSSGPKPGSSSGSPPTTTSGSEPPASTPPSGTPGDGTSAPATDAGTGGPEP